MDDEPIFARDEATRLKIGSQVRYLTSVRLRSEVALRGCDKLLADRYQQLVYETRVRHAAANFKANAPAHRKLQCCDASTVCRTTQDRHLRRLLGRAEKK